MIPFFQSEFDALQVLYNRFGEIPPTGDFGYFWWLFWLKNPIFRRDFEIGHNLGVSAYLPMPKNRKSSFGQAPAQNCAPVSIVESKARDWNDCKGTGSKEVFLKIHHKL